MDIAGNFSRLVATTLLLIGASASWAAPKIELDPEEISLGTVQEGEVVPVPLTVKNAGDAPLEIKDIRFSCGCLEMDELTDEQRRVAPGNFFDLPIIYDTTGFEGARKATIAVQSNDPEDPYVLATLELTILVPVHVEPRSLRWGQVAQGEVLEEEVTLRPGIEGSVVEVLALSVPNPDLELDASVEDSDGKKVIQTRLTVNSDAPLGPLNTILEARVRANDREFPVHVPVSMNVVGDMVVLPPSITNVHRQLPRGAQISFIKVLSTQEDQPVDLIDAVVSGPLAVTTSEVKPGEWQVNVFLADDAPSGPQAGLVNLFTTSEDRPIVQVPVYVGVAAAVSVSPELVALVHGDGAGGEQVVTLQGPDGAVDPVEATTAMDAIDVQLQPDQTRIVIRAVKSPENGVEAGFVTVRTDVKGAETVDIPVIVRGPSGDE